MSPPEKEVGPRGDTIPEGTDNNNIPLTGKHHQTGSPHSIGNRVPNLVACRS